MTQTALTSVVCHLYRVAGAARAKPAAAVVLAVGAVVVAVGLGPAPAEQPPTPPTSPVRTAGSPAAENATVEVRGRVLDPAGRSVAGARIYFLPGSVTCRPRTPSSYRKAATNADGTFRITIPAAEAKGTPIVIAAADGFGANWVPVEKAEDELTVRLVEDVPIEGRLIDLEGRPAPNVTVRLYGWSEVVGADLRPWLLFHNSPPGHDITLRFDSISLPDTAEDFRARTDSAGRFRLSGVGRERGVTLMVSGSAVASEYVGILTRPGVAIPKSFGVWVAGMSRHIHGPRFEHVLGPARSVTGTVRDRATGRPVAGVTVSTFHSGEPTITNREGRYRLNGLPLATEMTFTAYAKGSDAVHLGASQTIAGASGLEPLTIDFALERAVVVTGRLTERGTGQPVHGRISYVPLAGNAAANQPGLVLHPPSGNAEVETDADGRFRVLALPGPGILRAEATIADDVTAPNPFLPARLAEADRARRNLTVKDCNAYRLIDLPADAPTAARDVELIRGRAVDLRLEDADGRPVTGVTAAGLGSRPLDELRTGVFRESIPRGPKHDLGWLNPWAKVVPSDRVTVVGLEVEQPRVVAFSHPQRRLAATVSLRGNEPSPQTVRLRPAAAVAGRLIDREGQPLTQTRVVIDTTNPTAAAVLPILPEGLGIIRTDREGRFRFDGLLPGVPYELRPAIYRLAPGVAESLRGLNMSVGETKDLDDVRVEK